MTEQNAGSPLPTTNAGAQIANRSVQEIVNGEVTVAEYALIAAQPWLGWPVFKQIWEKAFSYFCDQLGIGLGFLAGKIVINVEEYFALKKAAESLVALNAAKATGDKDAIDKASQAADDAAAPILHYVGDFHSP